VNRPVFDPVPMSHSDFNPDAAIDAQLRAVSIPEGFVERLRRAVLSDDKLDALMREVPMPSELVDRLQQAPLANEELDAVVREVAVPKGLLKRVRRAALTTPRDKRGKAGFSRPLLYLSSERLRRRSMGMGRMKRFSQWAGALSLFLALGFGYIGVMAGLLLSTNAPPSPPLSATAMKTSLADTPKNSPEELFFEGWASPSVVWSTTVDEVAVISPPAPTAKFSLNSGLSRSWLSEVDRMFGRGVPDLLSGALLHRWGGVFATHRPFDELPELKKAAGLRPRGIEWPLVAGANSAFLIRYGVHPFISPASHPQLRVSKIPLGVNASSYELTKRWLEDGELPPSQLLHTEEFLAAVDYEFPRPTQQPLGLSVAAGPSPLGGAGRQLLQIGVQAAAYRSVGRTPVHLVLAVDVSASMRWGGRLDMVRRALGKMIQQMRPGDRVSLLAFSEDAEVLIEDVGISAADELFEEANSLEVRNSTNVGAGLYLAYSVAQQVAEKHGTSVRVILLTDGLSELDHPTAERIKNRLAEATPRGIVLDVIDLGQEQRQDLQLNGFAQSGGGSLRRAADDNQIRWALLETITGQSQLVAAEVSLKISFNPKSVTAYRIFGHEARTVAGVLPDHLETDFHVDQSGTALYEVQLTRGGPDEVANVELTWRPPEGGPPQSIKRKITRNEFAVTFSSAPVSLQEAAIVAGAAEVLLESPFAGVARHSVSLSRVLKLAGQVDSRLQQRPSFADFVATIKKAIRAKPRRGGGR